MKLDHLRHKISLQVFSPWFLIGHYFILLPTDLLSWTVPETQHSHLRLELQHSKDNNNVISHAYYNIIILIAAVPLLIATSLNRDATLPMYIGVSLIKILSTILHSRPFQNQIRLTGSLNPAEPVILQLVTAYWSKVLLALKRERAGKGAD